jgi:hypothetical protein
MNFRLQKTLRGSWIVAIAAVFISAISYGEDITPPVINCPADVVVECLAPVSGSGLDCTLSIVTILASTDPSVTGTATAVDDTDPDPVISFSDDVTPGACTGAKTIVRTWTATDADGNSSECDQTVEVSDTVAPGITCPSSVAVDCANVSASNDATCIDDLVAALSATSPGTTGAATATDLCDYSPTITFADVCPPGCPQVLTRTWTATDSCGNSSDCEQEITFTDTQGPVIACPADVAVPCVDVSGLSSFDCAIILVNQVNSLDPANAGTATATDCTAVTVDFNDLIGPGDCSQEKIITRTWTATDCDNQTATCVQTITVEDDIAPVITCPASVCIAPGDAMDPGTTGSASATDNCDPDPGITYSDTPVVTGVGITSSRL